MAPRERPTIINPLMQETPMMMMMKIKKASTVVTPTKATRTATMIKTLTEAKAKVTPRFNSPTKAATLRPVSVRSSACSLADRHDRKLGCGQAGA